MGRAGVSATVEFPWPCRVGPEAEGAARASAGVYRYIGIGYMIGIRPKKHNSARAWRGHDGAAPASAGAHRGGFGH
eukprot:scaffold27248_cov133-Isochrysis_galbana.AAC.5